MPEPRQLPGKQLVIRYRQVVSLAEDLADWVDWDSAAYLLGRSLDLFQGQDFQTAQGHDV